MLRLAPTLSAAALLAVMLAAAVPTGAAMMLNLVTMKRHVTVGPDDPATKRLADDAGSNVRRLEAMGSLRQYAL